MRSALTIREPATVRTLTTLEALKTELKIVGAQNDADLEEHLLGASEQIAVEIDAQRGEDGSVTLARETVEERFELDEAISALFLGRWPVFSRVGTGLAATIDGATVADADLNLWAAKGVLFRGRGLGKSKWPAGSVVVVTYRGGYALPGSNVPGETPDLPVPLARAARLAARYHWSSRQQPTVGLKSITTPDVLSLTFTDDATEAQIAFSNALRRLLEPYRRQIVA